MRTSDKQRAAKTPSPFDWRRPAASEGATAGKPARRAAKAAARPLSAQERAAQILAHRWGNPYCRPGAP